MIARWIERGPWAGGPLCFSSSGGWERLMDPNWTHIYCARFSWSVTGMMMPQLEPLTGWLCLLFWKVFSWMRRFFFPCHCDPCFQSQVPSGHLGKSPLALTKGMMAAWFVSCRRVTKAITILLAYERKNARTCETARRVRKLCFEMSVQEPATEHKVIFTPVFRVKCEQSQGAC